MKKYLEATEAVALMERYFGEQFCLTYEVMVFARHAKQFHAMRQLVAQWREKEKNMLSVTGKAEFVAEGKALEIEVRIQPSTPEQHDLLERIVSQMPKNEQVAMTGGYLVIKEKFLVPAIPAATESESQSTSTSAKTEDDKEGDDKEGDGEPTIN